MDRNLFFFIQMSILIHFFPMFFFSTSNFGEKKFRVGGKKLGTTTPIFLFGQITFSKNSFKNTIRVSNSLDQDQAQHFVGA